VNLLFWALAMAMVSIKTLCFFLEERTLTSCERKHEDVPT
jgi:hypothetical protein